MINFFNSHPMFSLSASSVSNQVAMTSGCFDPNHANVSSVYEQAVNTFGVLDKQLKEMNLTKDHIIGADVWLLLRAKTEEGTPYIAPEDAKQLNKAWIEYFNDRPKPTSATVGVGFMIPTFLVEIRFYLAN
ncbi:RidA family protein [Vibrio comitans]|uniref:Enamine deaminase RidA n=1 Tax=Vibrio comitans NBRC 102076 TaxID=1219078 RepID=A0A4Y3IK05_9VIBR|nr:RidA family protein [Vibrio comitans]GEA59342.1 hypothetical protein VCO01S_05350 [Vibrio comitans NBRC 102076]